MSVPDIAGVWQVWNADPVAAQRIDPQWRPADAGMPTLRGEYQKLLETQNEQEARRDKENRVQIGSAQARRETGCLPYGMPSMMDPVYTLEILQSPRQVTVIAEAMLEVRRIYLDRPQLPLEEIPPSYEGRSVGHYEGDALLVDTVGVKKTVAGPLYVPHSEQMSIHERIRRVAPDLLQNVVTVADPLAFERPFTYTLLLRRLHDYETPEYYCDNLRETVDPATGEIRLRLE